MKHILVLGIVFSAFHASHSNTPEFCKLPHVDGQGTSFKFSFYYDPDNNWCTPFVYNGEGGNGNRFDNERECIRNCSTDPNSVYPLDAREACRFKREPGKCNSNLLRYYYDPFHHKCKKFFWTGCYGNGNRFTDQSICNTTCYGIHEDHSDPEEDEPDTPFAIIFGVLLSIIIASVLITVIILVVKSKKQKSKKKSPGKRNDPQSDAPLQDREIEMS